MKPEEPVAETAKPEIHSIRGISAIIPDEFCERIFAAVVRRQKNLSTTTRNRVQHALRTSVTISGFRDANLAPEKLLLQHSVCAFRQHSAELIASLLQAWLELETNLVGSVRAYLIKKDIVTGIPDKLPCFILGLLDAEQLRTKAEDYSKSDNTADPHAVALIIFCLTAWRPLLEAPESAEEESNPGFAGGTSMRSHTVEEIERELDSLAERFRDLGVRLAVVGNDLSQDTRLPDLKIASELTTVHADFTQIDNQIVGLAAEFKINAATGDKHSIAELRTLLHAIAQADAERRRTSEIRKSALRVLDRVQLLVHREHRKLEQLENCQSSARELHLALTEESGNDLATTAGLLSDGSHPFAQLLRLVENPDEFDDEQWQKAEELITNEFGRAVAIAAARRRLYVAEQVINAEHNPADDQTIGFSSNNSQQPNAIDRMENAAGEEFKLPPSDISLDRASEGTDLESLTQSNKPEKIQPPQAQQQEIGAPTEPKSDSQSDYNRQLSTNNDVIQPPRSGTYDTLIRLIWAALTDNRVGLGFHLANYIEEEFPEPRHVPPSWLLRAVAVAPNILFPTGEIAETIRADFARFDPDIFDTLDTEWNQSVRFLFAAAALRPAIIAPATGASAILHSLYFKDKLDALYQYCQVIADFASRAQPLHLNAVKRVKTQAGWDASIQSLQQQVNAWCVQAPRMTMVYAPASKVWRKWQEPSGLIDTLLVPVRTNESNKLPMVRELVARLGDEANIKREVEATDRKILKRRHGDEISAKAMGQLIKHVRDAVGFARSWLALQESNPAREHTYFQEQAEELRNAVLNLQGDVEKELNELDRKSSSPSSLAGTESCRRALKDIERLFDPDVSLPANEIAVDEILNSDLLFTALPLNASWYLEASRADTEDAIVDLISHGNFDWRSAFDLRTRLRDHEGTGLILEHLQNLDDQMPDLADLRQVREKHVRECSEALMRDINSTKKDLDKAVTFGLLKETEWTELAARIEKVFLAASQIVRFQPAHQELENVRRDIEATRNAQVAEVRSRLDSVDLQPTARERVIAALEKGDVLTANEYIDIARSGRSLPSVDAEPDAFTRFFPETYREIEEFLEPPIGKVRPDPSSLIRELNARAKGTSNRTRLGPISLSQVPGKQIEQCALMLESWFSIKRSQRAELEHLKQVLLGLGFGQTAITIERSGRRVWLKVTTDPIRDRERCPVAFFGSAAEGSYRLLCTWDRPTEEDLITEVSETSHSAPAIVFYFGRMSEKVRRDLSRLSKRRFRTFAVVDDILVFYLCGERGVRLPTMFRCTFPFTFLEPYGATAGLVPPEMFYGRSAERNQIIDRMGSCFIYGGRQLGKTALLRDAEQSFHCPDDGRIGLWIDLKTYGIGFDRPVEEFWSRLGHEFKQLQLIPQTMPAHAGADIILKHLESWLNQDGNRRVLLLLDEADRFLEQDSKHDFVHTARLKGLMDRANRRFKVVFAGLHNVQRTTRLENNPLAHYGEPICIGPLLENGEWKEAWQLVEQPLGSVGYKFDSADLITRILSQTNYYPSLIQLYCTQLLRHMHKQAAEDRSGPPYTITSSHVEEAYRSNELRKAIRDRFTWTLDLDPRYRVIAFCLALYSAEEFDRADRGFSVSWIREQAVTFWSKGFADIQSEDVFRVLLDEMVGLGVLRTTENGQYALRSLSVISLLGSKEEIETELDSFVDREPPQPYEAATFRSALGTNDRELDLSRRNPLTAAQQSELRARRNGGAVVFGCNASGIEDLEPFLSRAFDSVLRLDAVADLAAFSRTLNELENRGRDGVTLILVLPTCAWTSSWVTEASRRLSKLTSRTAFVRILFVADPMSARTVMRDIDLLQGHGATTLTLTPWHDSALQHWLDEIGVANNAADRQRITQVTGNWPALLRVFYQRCARAPHRSPAVIEEIDQQIRSSRQINGLDAKTLFGVTRHEAEMILGDLAALEEASASELAAVNSEVLEDTAVDVLNWAKFLSLCQPTGGDRVRIDPILARFLRPTS